VLCAVLSLLALPVLAVAASGVMSGTTTTVVPSSAPVAPPARSVYVVQPGDTLWAIAHKVDPHADPRDVVDRLVELNGAAALQPGQRLRLSDE
jgi:nucleoid-associated protein YgaU